MRNTEKKTSKPRLQDMEPRELRDMCRKLRDERNTAREQLADAKERIAVLQASERQLRSENEALLEANEGLQASVAELNEQLSAAMDNNTKLQGIVESAGNGEIISDDLGVQIIERMDIMTGLLGSINAVLGGSEDTDFDGDDEDDIDDDDMIGDDAPILPLRARDTEESAEADFQSQFPGADESVDEDEDEDEDGEQPQDDWEANNPQSDAEDEADEILPVHGVDAVIDPAEETVAAEATEVAGDDQVSGVSESELTMLVSPAIKLVVDHFEGYEDTILKAIQTGAMTKELALRTIVTQAYPQHPEMADAILGAQSTRDAVYALMGV